MGSPFSIIEDLRLMNETMVSRLDEIIQRLDRLLALEEINQRDRYGDGR